MSLPARIVTLLVAFAAVVAGAVFIVLHYLGSSLEVVNYSSVASGGVVNVVLQEDPQNNSSSEPDWVSYYVQDPQTKAWVHTTLFSVPKNTRVNMTILGYDGCTPLRNNFLSLVQGTARQRDDGAAVQDRGPAARAGQAVLRPSTPGRTAASGTRSPSPACTCSCRWPRLTPRCSTRTAAPIRPVPRDRTRR